MELYKRKRIEKIDEVKNLIYFFAKKLKIKARWKG